VAFIELVTALFAELLLEGLYAVLANLLLQPGQVDAAIGIQVTAANRGIFTRSRLSGLSPFRCILGPCSALLVLRCLTRSRSGAFGSDRNHVLQLLQKIGVVVNHLL